MTLTLEITDSSEGNPRDTTTRHVFGEEGGTIGRRANSSWVLSHNKVSGRHAEISFRGGVFYIKDVSSNGVSIKSPENRLVHGRAYRLATGERIFIEPYQIDVWVDDDAPQPRSRSSRTDPFATDDPFALPYDRPASVRNEEPAPVADESIVDPLAFFDPVGGRAKRKPEPIVPDDDFLNAHWAPPAPVPSAPPPVADSSVIPADYNPLGPDDPVAPPPPPPPPSPPVRPNPGNAAARRRPRETTPSSDSTIRQPVPPPAPPIAGAPDAEATPAAPAPPRAEVAARPAGHSADLAELLAGAGVPDAAITPELSRSLGQILRIVVSGLMDVLQSRQRIKDEFGMQRTIFRPKGNNPLKFSANLEDALHNLLVKRNAAYLSPVDAFADAFDDLRDHQLAMLAGMRVAFETMLAEFDPDKLQQEFDAQVAKHSLPLMPAKLRYWDMYRDRRQALMKDPEAAFIQLFGEEFSRAYEEQFTNLKETRPARKKTLPDGDPPTT